LKLFVALLVLGVAHWPLALGAQHIIRVLGARGEAIRFAQVELWSATALVAARVTDSTGLARFLVSDLSRGRAVLVRRIGFVPARVPVSPALDSLVLRLESLPGTLPAVTVTSARSSCPQAEDARARAQWASAAALYRVPSLEGRKADVESRRATVTEAEVGEVGDRTQSRGWRFYTLGGMEGARSGIANRGYARALTGNHTYDDFGAWRYPPLHAELSGHFVDPLFGDRHTFAVGASSSRTTVLRFCARDRRQDGLDGTMRLEASGALIDARWTFWNPRRDAESAGGAVIFAPPAEVDVEPLFSASGLFWRRLPSGRYLQSWQGYSQWELLTNSLGARRAPPSSAR
jgi:hypothetical protein